MSKPFIAGNWKMHLTTRQSAALAERVEKQAAKYADEVEVALFPSALAVDTVRSVVSTAGLGVQSVHFADEGAYTGEVSAAQAAELAKYALVGHSERRHIFGETDEMIARKTAACMRNNITPIVCVGETQHEREEGETVQVLNDQIATDLTMLTAQDVTKSIIAYEPVWAIGTGDNARPEDVAKAVTLIRRTITEMFGAKVGEAARVLYGGSVKADTAGAYLELEEVNGLLVGGSSLNDQEFSGIIERAAHGKK